VLVLTWFRAITCHVVNSKSLSQNPGKLFHTYLK